MDGTDQAKVKFRYYYYDPSVAGALAFTVLFSLAAVHHAVLLVKHKTWYFIPFFIGCLFEIIAYVARTISAKQTPDWALGPFIIQSLGTLLAPTLFAASIYMILGRLIRLLDAGQYSLVRTNWLTKVFVAGDVLSFCSQGAGGGLLAKAKSKADQDVGNNVILAGLGIQVVFFGVFIVVALVFHWRIARQPTARSYAVTAPWQSFLYVLYASSLLIMVRSIYRMVEYGQGAKGILQQNEGYFWGLDAVLMLIVEILYGWFHPYKIISGNAAGGSSEAIDAEMGTDGGYQMVDGASVGGKLDDSSSPRLVASREF